MFDKERQRVTYLIVLICCTIWVLILAGEAVLLQWEVSTVLFLAIGCALCWWIHITQKLPEIVRLWITVVITMMAFFFYGSHETSIYDMTAIAIVLMVLYALTEIGSAVTAVMCTYYVTFAYDIAFIYKGFAGLGVLDITRILLHIGVVYMAAYIIRNDMIRRRKEREYTADKIVQLEETNRRTEDFLTNVSHELRTPINAVIGISETMLRTEADSHKRKDIYSIRMAGHRLFNQIEDILDFTELDTGRIRVSDDAYMVASLINDILEENRLNSWDNKPELIVDIDALMPSVLQGDGRKIKKILKHLIDNGLKFTKRGAVYVKVYTRPKSYGVNLCIQVSDTGIGIQPEELQKLKEKFYQTSSGRNRRTGGLGLGLSIVYGMVAALEGFIQMDSQPGKGTTVSVSIPQKVVDSTSNMMVNRKEELCLGCFLKPEKYVIPEVRIYYNELISHLVSSLDIPLHRVSNTEELKQLISKYRLTHLFVGDAEYKEYQSYLEKIDSSIEVVVVAGEDFDMPLNGRFKKLQKPFYCLPIVNLLNADTIEEEQIDRGEMCCPGVKILVVDDEPMNRMVAEGIFKGYQMEVRTAGSGIEALEICQKEAFDLIFLDHMMPDMDGVETLKRLRKEHIEDTQPMTVIAFTANAVSGAKEMFLAEGFDEFISKPIERFDLERVLRKTLPKSAISYKPKAEHNAIVEQHDREETEESAVEIQPVKKDEMTALAEAGINTNAGLQYCAQDQDFYRELLRQFVKEASQKQKMLEDYCAKEDWDAYRIQIHGVKSTSKTIGADELSAMAKEAEDAAKRQDAGYIKQHQPEIMDMYQKIVQGIVSSLEEKPTQKEVQSVQAEPPVMSAESPQLSQQLKELRECLDTYEAEKAEAVLECIGEVEKPTTQKLLQEIQNDIDAFEFEAAINKVDRLIQEMKGGEAQ